MLSIHILCVGKLKEQFYIDAAQEYQKRLSPYCKLVLTELPEEKLPKNPSQGEIDGALRREAAAIRAKLPPNANLVALCVEGRMRSSQELAQLLAAWKQNSTRRLVFLIGGSYGLAVGLKTEASAKLSMSPISFPHHLATVILLEQSYRGFHIHGGSPYTI